MIGSGSFSILSISEMDFLGERLIPIWAHYGPK